MGESTKGRKEKGTKARKEKREKRGKRGKSLKDFNTDNPECNSGRVQSSSQINPGRMEAASEFIQRINE